MSTLEQMENKKQINRKRVLAAYDWMGTLIVGLIVLSLLLTYVFRVVGVRGDSMLPTLKNGDRLLLSAASANSDYRYGDIIVVDRYTNEPLIKRVIACEGQTISIDENGVVTVDGKILSEEHYIQGKTILKDFSGEVTVPEGYLFVMGDNRSTSRDSRSADIGLVSKKDVVGRALYRVWPVRSIGKV